ncbi:hypothetical protein [Ramlibacter sp. 2FC]|uniref:hypothetical protein n=1 Tax=Ramlibacter sp. 2FC TaxID=2502188 RepID=UPI0010F973EB|nr:hypothetical protein [Ramlibacter sp. 2FC]
MLGEVSVADAEAVIQAAVNLAIGRGHTPVIVTRQDVLLATELVMGRDQGILDSRPWPFAT